MERFIGCRIQLHLSLTVSLVCIASFLIMLGKILLESVFKCFSQCQVNRTFSHFKMIFEVIEKLLKAFNIHFFG